jgi:biotin transport system ATP-binding protein
MQDPPPLASPSSGPQLTHATVAFQGRAVLHDITLSLREQRIGIVGRNGSGKTTLLRLMAGLIAPTSGSVRVCGLDPATARKAMLGKLGILFQNPDHQILFPTVIEEMVFGLRQMGLAQAEALTKAERALAREGRVHWRDRPCHHLSQGQRHYLCLMAVLAMQPETVLLDEPFAGLDLPSQLRLARRFAALPQRLITISHDPDTVRDCERVIWLEAGQLAGDGPADQILPAFEAEMARRGGLDADTDLSA